MANYRLHTLGFQQSGDCFAVTNLIPEVLTVPFPLTSGTVPHASQTQQTPIQIQSGSPLSLSSQAPLCWLRELVTTCLAASPAFPLTEVPPLCHLLTLCCPLYSHSHCCLRVQALFSSTWAMEQPPIQAPSSSLVHANPS